LSAHHPTERLLESIKRAAEAGKPQGPYIAGIARTLAKEGWTSPPTLTFTPNPFAGLCGETDETLERR
jgi:hypothetical protein